MCGRLTFLHSVDHSGSTTINETGITLEKRSREMVKCMKSDMNEGKAQSYAEIPSQLMKNPCVHADMGSVYKLKLKVKKHNCQIVH